VSEVSPGHRKLKFQRLIKKGFLLVKKATTLWSALYFNLQFTMSHMETFVVYFNASLWKDPYDEIHEYPELKAVILWPISILILIIGNLMLFGIIMFERYGGDPLKRSILNQVRYNPGPGRTAYFY
jgi:hypothetical protein